MSIEQAIERAGPIPPDSASREEKKAYSELLSRELAFGLASILRTGPLFATISPNRTPKEDVAASSTQRLKVLKDQSPEKYFLGGFGRKKLDVSLANEQDGLLLAVSIKTITSRDGRSKNYNKNFKNRFGDLCAEATSIHMRSPYTVANALFAMPTAAAFDDTDHRLATAYRAVRYLRSISGRKTHEESPERFEQVTFMLFEPQGATAHPLDEVNFFTGSRSGHHQRFRLFDVWAREELTEAEYVARITEIFLERNPFMDER